MARKINKPFILIVAGTLVAVSLVIGGLVFIKLSKDPIRHIRQADAYIEEGDYKNAHAAHMRAIGKAPFEIDYYDMSIDSLVSIVPQTQQDANDRYDTYKALLFAKAEKLPSDEAYPVIMQAINSHRAVFEGIESEPGQQVVKVFDAFSELLEPYPDMVDSDKERAAILTHVNEHLWRYPILLAGTEWEDAERKLQEMVDLDPKNAYNQYVLMRARFDRAQSELKGARKLAGQRTLKKLDGQLAEARKAAGESPVFDLLEFEKSYRDFAAGRSDEAPNYELITTISNGFDGSEERFILKEVFARAQQMQLTKLNNQDPLAGVKATQSLMELRRGIAEKLYEKNPDDYRNQMLYITTRSGDEIPVAQEMAIGMSKEILPSVGLNARLHQSTILQSSNYNFEIVKSNLNEARVRAQDLSLSGRATPSEIANANEAIDSALIELQNAHAELTSLFENRLGNNDSILVQFDLDLAYAEGKWDVAMQKLNQLAASGNRMDSNKLLVAVDIAMKAGDYGSAKNYMNQLIEARPGLSTTPRFALLRAQLAIGTGDVAAANEIAEKIIEFAVENPSISDATIRDAKVILRQTQSAMGIKNEEDSVLREIYRLAQEASINGDTEKQKEILLAGLLTIERDEKKLGDPTDGNRSAKLQLLSSLAILEISSLEGSTDVARGYAERILEIDPDNKVGILFENISSKSSVNGLRLLAQYVEPDDELLREQSYWISLRRERDRLKSAQLKSELDPGLFSLKERADLDLSLEEVDQEYQIVKDSIYAREDQNITVLNYMIEEKLADLDFDAAQSIYDELIAKTDKTWKTDILGARILATQGDMKGAVSFLQSAIDVGRSNSSLLRYHGLFLYEIGELNSAIETLARAYTSSPGNIQIILDYTALLIENNQVSDALQVFRRSAIIGRRNSAYLNNWLALESAIGDSEIAINERQLKWELSPADTVNAVSLAGLLVNSPINQRSILDPKTMKIKYRDSEWARLNKATRENESQKVRAQRAEFSRGIFEKLSSRPNPPAMVFMSWADTLESQGDRAGAIELLEQTLKTENSGIGDAEKSILAIDIARRLNAVANTVEAEKWFSKARAFQPKNNPIADKAILGLAQQTNNVAEIIKALENILLLDATPNADKQRPAYLRILVRSLIDINDINEAEKVFNTHFAGSNEPSDLLLLASINFAKGRRAWSEANQVVAIEMLDAASSLYEDLSVQAPGLSEPYLQLALLNELRYQWTDEMKYIEAGIQYARLALSKNKSNWIAQQLLSIMLVRSEDMSGGIGTLENYLDSNPTNDDARYLLVQMYEASGNLERMVELCQAAVDKDPYSVAWNVRLGRYRGQQERFEEAAESFRVLYDMTNDIGIARLYVDMLLRRDPPNHQVALAFARSNPDKFTDDPYLAGAYALTLAHAGRVDTAIAEFESAHSRFKDLGESPSKMYQLGSWLARILEVAGDDDDIAESSALMFDQLNSGNPTIGDRMALARTYLTNDDEESLIKAVANLKSVVAVGPDVHQLGTTPYTILGSLLIDLGRCEEALPIFEAALEMSPRDGSLMNNLAYSRAVCGGDLPKAFVNAENAVATSPFNSNFLDTLGFIELKMGNIESANVSLRRSLSRRRTPSNLIHMSMVRVAQKEFDEAEMMLKEAGDLDPSSDEQAQIRELIDEISANKAVAQ
jgi:Tfp pilus assembly protein PilF